MNSDIRLDVDFWNVSKTRRLIRNLGVQGAASLIQLWCYAAKHRPDGVLRGMDEDDVEEAAAWPQDRRGELVGYLSTNRWLERSEAGVYVIHEWLEHNPWAAREPLRKERGQHGAHVRYHVKRNDPQPETCEWCRSEALDRLERIEAGIGSGSSDHGQTNSQTIVEPAETLVTTTKSVAPAPAPAPAPLPSPAPVAEEEERDTARARLDEVEQIASLLHTEAKLKVEPTEQIVLAWLTEYGSELIVETVRDCPEIHGKHYRYLESILTNRHADPSLRPRSRKANVRRGRADPPAVTVSAPEEPKTAEELQAESFALWSGAKKNADRFLTDHPNTTGAKFFEHIRIPLELWRQLDAQFSSMEPKRKTGQLKKEAIN